MHNVYDKSNIYFLYDNIDRRISLIGNKEDLINKMYDMGLFEVNKNRFHINDNYYEFALKKSIVNINGSDYKITTKTEKIKMWDHELDECYNNIITTYFKEQKRFIFFDGYNRIINPFVFQNEINEKANFYKKDINEFYKYKRKSYHKKIKQGRAKHSYYIYRNRYSYIKTSDIIKNDFDEDLSIKNIKNISKNSHRYFSRRSVNWKYQKNSQKSWGKNRDNVQSIRKYNIEMELEEELELQMEMEKGGFLYE